MIIYRRCGRRASAAPFPAYDGLLPARDPVDQLAHRRDEAVAVERIAGEAEGVVPGEHELMPDVRAVDDRLQRLLDAVGARVGAAPVGARLFLRPVAYLAARQAAHAVDLRSDERVVGKGGVC